MLRLPQPPELRIIGRDTHRHQSPSLLSTFGISGECLYISLVLITRSAVMTFLDVSNHTFLCFNFFFFFDTLESGQTYVMRVKHTHKRAGTHTDSDQASPPIPPSPDLSEICMLIGVRRTCVLCFQEYIDLVSPCL